MLDLDGSPQLQGRGLAVEQVKVDTPPYGGRPPGWVGSPRGH